MYNEVEGTTSTTHKRTRSGTVVQEQPTQEAVKIPESMDKAEQPKSLWDRHGSKIILGAMAATAFSLIVTSVAVGVSAANAASKVKNEVEKTKQHYSQGIQRNMFDQQNIDGTKRNATSNIHDRMGRPANRAGQRVRNENPVRNANRNPANRGAVNTRSRIANQASRDINDGIHSNARFFDQHGNNYDRYQSGNIKNNPASNYNRGGDLKNNSASNYNRGARSNLRSSIHDHGANMGHDCRTPDCMTVNSMHNDVVSKHGAQLNNSVKLRQGDSQPGKQNPMELNAQLGKERSFSAEASMQIRKNKGEQGRTDKIQNQAGTKDNSLICRDGVCEPAAKLTDAQPQKTPVPQPTPRQPKILFA